MEPTFRHAREDDLPALVRMLADDVLGASREDLSEPLNDQYIAAFKRIEADPNNELIVLEVGDDLAGMMQLTFIPYLSRTGTTRCLIEGVRVHSDLRGSGLGRRMFQWAMQRSREKGCGMVQLTSDKDRADAVRFYESLGFKATHEGFKLDL